MLELNNNKRLFYIEMAPRTGAATWGSWQDITKYFIKYESDIVQELEDTTDEGSIIQKNVTILVNNIRGSFNTPNTTNSLWGSGEYIYHSRIRIYDFFEYEETGATYGVKPTTIDPIFDGLIGREPNYLPSMQAIIILVSKLDVLREHYLSEDFSKRIKAINSQAVIKKVIDLFDTTYSELGVTTNGGYLRGSFMFNDLTPYGNNLLNLFTETITKGGCIAGLDTEDNLFITFFGNSTVTKKDFENNTDNNIGTYVFDTSWTGSMSGEMDATIFDDSTSGNDIKVTYYDDTPTNTAKANLVLSTGYYDKMYRNFYGLLYDNAEPPVLQYSYSSLTDFSIEFILNINTLVHYFTQSPHTESAALFYFSEANPYDYTAGGADAGDYYYGFQTSVAISKKEVGLVVDSTGTIYLVSGECSTIDEYDFKSNIPLIQLPTEDSFFYFAMTYNDTSGEYKVYMDGTLVKTVTDLDGYDITDLTLKKLVYRGGYQYRFENGIQIHASNFRIHSDVRTDTEIYNTYKYIYGNSYDFANNTYTYSNFYSKNLGRIVSYDNGSKYIKNYIVYDSNISEQGYVKFAFGDTSPAYVIINIYNQVFVTFTVQSMEELMSEFYTTATTEAAENVKLLREIGGLSLEVSDSLSTFSKSLILKCNGKVDYRDVMLFVTYSLSPVTDTSLFTMVRGDLKTSTYSYSNGYSIPLIGASINNTTIAKDDTSITSYGKKILFLKTFDMLTEQEDKMQITSNYLANKSTLKARIVIQVPYRSNNFNYLDEIILNISKFNTKQIPFIEEEGGHFMDWTLSGSYRTKSFYIIGITHASDGSYTQLTLREQ